MKFRIILEGWIDDEGRTDLEEQLKIDVKRFGQLNRMNTDYYDF